MYTAARKKYDINAGFVSHLKNMLDKKEEELNSIRIENENKLKGASTNLKRETEKSEKAKQLMEDYNDALTQLKTENAKLKSDCEMLVSELNKLPKFIRKVFIKSNDVKLLLEKNN